MCGIVLRLALPALISLPLSPTLCLQAPDMNSTLGSLRLWPAVAAACGAVVCLAQDCEEQQRGLTSSPDVLPALFRLLSVDEPRTATQAAR
jgi:hypothetical protein